MEIEIRHRKSLQIALASKLVFPTPQHDLLVFLAGEGGGFSMVFEEADGALEAGFEL